MTAEARRRKMLALVKDKGSLSAAQISARLQISRKTAYHDLDYLAAAGLLRRIRGGAALVERLPAAADLVHTFSERTSVNVAAKEAIARHLFKIITGARSLALDDSTTIFALAHLLPPNPDQFVLTNGLPLFLELRQRNLGLRLALTGGEPFSKGGSLIGPLAVKTLEGLRFDYVVMSAMGWMQERGEIYDASPELVTFKRALLSRAHKAILALDKNKINFLAPYPLCRLDAFDLLVTEDGPQETKISGRSR